MARCFICSSAPRNPPREIRPRKLDHRSRKRIPCWVCGGRSEGLLFPSATGETLRHPGRWVRSGESRAGKNSHGTGARSIGKPRLGAVERPNGDPSGSSGGHSTGGSSDPHLPGNGESGHRIAAVFGSRQSSERPSEASAYDDSERSWVPGPTPIGTRAPRGLRLRPMLPRGLLAFLPGERSEHRGSTGEAGDGGTQHP